MKPKLKPLPCPFCGSAPEVVPKNPAEEGDAWGAVLCVALRCAANPKVQDGTRINDSRGPGAYMDNAIKRWNKRA